MKTLILTAVFGLLTILVPFFARAQASERLVIVVNKAQKGTAVDAQTIEAFVDGELLVRTSVSTAKEIDVHAGPSKNYPEGRTYRAHTPTGSFHITSRDIDHVSNTWQDARMPFAQFFIGGIALHATVPEHFAMIGTRDSGGCVRMLPKDAKYMWQLVDYAGVAQTLIIVYDGSETPHPLGRLHDAPKYEAPSQN